MRMTAEMTGQREVERLLRRISRIAAPETVEPIIERRANKLRDKIRSATPVGETGNLKRSIIVRKLSRRGGHPAPYIVASDRKIAIYGEFIERGHRIVRGGRVVGFVRAKPFFHPVIRRVGPSLNAEIIGELRREIRRIAN